MLMHLTVYTPDHNPRDIGYLLHKHPDRVQEFGLSFGKTVAWYPQIHTDKIEFALLMDLDPLLLTRGKGQANIALQPYVNDRAYTANSFFVVAMNKALRSTMAGSCTDHPELVDTKFQIECEISVVKATTSHLLRDFLNPLGYEVECIEHPIDPKLGMDETCCITLKLKGHVTLQRLLQHLAVFLPAVDQDKHYYVDDAEIAKLERLGDGWLTDHPKCKEITQSYLGKHLMRRTTDDVVKKPQTTLHEQRHIAVIDALRRYRAKDVVDLGCGEGKLLSVLGHESNLSRVVGMDIASSELERAAKRLQKEGLGNIKLLHGSLLYEDDRLTDMDAAVLVEVIEHLDLDRLDLAMHNIFTTMQPRLLVATTPNQEYNVVWSSDENFIRHRDHRFEWTRDEFSAWAHSLAKEYGYQIREHTMIGDVVEDIGGASQMIIWEKNDGS